jgi:hypothetical protein
MRLVIAPLLALVASSPAAAQSLAERLASICRASLAADGPGCAVLVA